MKAKERQLMERCVEDGAQHVWRRAFKHHPDPPVFSDSWNDAIKIAIVHEVMDSIDEWFEFDNVAIEDL